MKRYVIGIAILIVAVVIYGLYQYNKGPITLDKKSADIEITSDDLLNAYLKDENVANSMYLDKVLEVSGKVDAILKDETVVTIKLESDDLMSAVVCEMGAGFSSDISEGDPVIIKGQCTGFLMDVILVKCVLKN